MQRSRQGVTTLSSAEARHWDAIRDGAKEMYGARLWCTAKEHWHEVEMENDKSIDPSCVRAWISGFFAGLANQKQLT